MSDDDVKLLAKSLVRTLTPEEVEAVKVALSRKIAHADHLRRCQDCGFNTDNHAAVHDQQTDILKTILRRFGPDSAPYPPE